MHDITILVTGASGFIGSLLFNTLNQHHSYTIYAADYENNFNRIDKAKFIKMDLADFNAVSSVFEKFNPDVIIHCAGIAHQKVGSIDSDEYLRINSLATENLAKTSFLSNKDVRFIFLSSISVYGEDNMTTPISEEAVCNPSSDYAHSKLDAELRLIKLYNDGMLKKLDILRLAPVYDPTWSLNLDRRVLAPMKIAYVKFGSGHQAMSAVSRMNLVDFILFMIGRREIDGEKYYNIYNVCDETPYSFDKIIKTFKQSRYQPNRVEMTIPLPLVWLLTRMAGLIVRGKKKWLHSCYDKLANNLVFDNKRMLDTGFKPKENLESVFLRENKL